MKKFKPVKKILFVIFTIWAWNHPSVFGQEQKCGGGLIDPSPIGSALVNCIDVADVYNNNTIVYIRINMHFFIGPDCDASVVHLAGVPDPIDPYDLYSIAEAMVKEANIKLANNHIQWGWGGPHPAPHQIPIRYVLSDIHLHCVTEEMPPILFGQNPQTMAGVW